MKHNYYRGLWAAALFSSTLLATAQPVLTFSSSKRGPLLGDLHYGIFYEEINHGGDRGLYAELIRNRSFEDNTNNPDCWWGLGAATFEMVHNGLLNSAQGSALKLNINEYNAGIRNEGFWGMNIRQGEEYTLTFWAKTDGNYSGKMWAELQNDGFENLGRTEFPITLTSQWKKYEVKITATGSNQKGWLALKGLEPMTVYLDMVSLMPPTYKDRPNGCRKDLAEMLANLKPSFVRFPGGCYIEGTWRDEQTNRFEWKKTVGPIETRPGHFNVNWGYRVSDGLGFHELLQFTEDIGAEPLFVCNIGLGHGWMQPYDQLNDYIREALDAIEYCNGDVTTPYGKLRAENGHPAPFNLRLLEIGNENYNFIPEGYGDQSDHYAERYAAFYKAIKAKYPDMILIGNVESWGTDDPSWRNGNPVEMVDEHYYRSTEWFKRQYNKYDNYSRDGYKVYAGEYAVTSDFGAWGNLNAALGEAIYMAGMERNSDICRMASYAPIFCNENHAYPWMPDMIRFNSYSAFGTPSYYVQKLMASNVGHQNITWQEENNTTDILNTSIGLSSWGTNVSYDNLSIVNNAGDTLYQTDFSNPDDYARHWTPNGGNWTIEQGTLQQTSLTMYGDCNVCNIPTGDNCTIELDATKTSGEEGFLIAFSYNDPKNYIWWNLGGWGNTKHAIEQCTDGVKSTLASTDGNLKTGQTYHLKIVKAGGQVFCYIDGTLCHQIALENPRKVYTCAALNKAEDELIVKLINPSHSVQSTTFRLSDFKTNGDATADILTSASCYDENIMQNQQNVYPTTSTVNLGNDPQSFVYDIPAYSLVVMRIPVAQVSEEQKEYENKDGWQDITNRIVNANFSEGQTGWKGSTFSIAPGTVAEFFDKTFNCYQQLTDMPAGEYKLTIDGFYRNGNITNAYKRHTRGTEQLQANIYLRIGTQTETAPLQSLYDESAPYMYEPNYTYPDNVNSANLAFNMKGAYHNNSVSIVNPTDGATLRLGLSKSSSMSSDWACFDNVRLYYRDLKYTSIQNVGKNAQHPSNGVYDLMGRKLATESQIHSLAPGFYIVNGKKVWVK